MGEMDRPLLVTGYAFVVLAISLLPSCYGACTYPSDLTGVWYTSHEKNAELTWTGSNVTSFEYTTTGSTFSGLTYECFLNEGNFYVSKTTGTISIFGADFYVYTCWVFTKKSSDKYLYRQAVSKESRVDDARVKVFLVAVSITQASEICDDTDYERNQYSILVRNGTAEAQKTTCPSPLLMTGRYTITDDGGTTYCDGSSWIDGCTDKSTLTANYTICNDNVFFSAEGVLYCMYSTGFGQSGVYYTTLFNADPSPDESSTYYFTCAVSDSRSDGVHVTYYPGDCLNATYQNATYISESTGFNLVIQTNTTCVSSSSESNLALILGITFGILFLIALIILLVYIWYIKVYLVQKKRRSSRAGSKVVPDTLPNTAMSQGDKNYRMMFTPAPPKSAAPGGRHIDYRDNGGQFGSQTSMRPPVSQLAFYRTPTPRITDSKLKSKSASPKEPGVKQQDKQDTSSTKPEQEVEMLAISTPPISTTSPVPPRKKEEEDVPQKDSDEGVVLPDTSPELEEQQVVVPPPSSKGSRKKTLKAKPTKEFMGEIADSFQTFFEKQKSLPPTGRSTPTAKGRATPTAKGRSTNTPTPKTAQPRGRNTDKLASARSIISKRATTPRSSSSPKRPLSRDPSKKPSSLPSESGKSKDMDLDSVLDFDSKRLGEPDGAESGVVMDMEGSLPVFSDSGDLTPEPTRITPRGKINKPKKTPRGMAL